ncbi:hypothetical protein MANES_18G126754v8 [Manihot esculenta]|uniref:Uncharacterized protein n=1 Tax=Manihot esculenta TaxID=3983 RepID=A0ACB7G0E7_MANES|nr:hypothetical protein MANES_18G126754v8 [Manihot esculenta]
MPRRAVSSRGRGHSQYLSMNEIDEAVQVQEEILEHTLQALGGQANASSSSSSRYALDESEEGMVRIAWEKVGKERLRDILNRVRSELLRKHKKTDVAYLYNLGPDWMETEIWNEFVAYWSTPEWLEIIRVYCVKLGRQPTQLELFCATHTKKGSQGVFIDGKSRRVDGAYLSAIAENVNDNCESQSAFDLNKWIEISGSKQNRIKMKQDIKQMQEQMRVQIEKQIKDQMKSSKNKNRSSPHNTTADSDGSTNS